MRALLLLAVLTVGCKSRKEAAPAPGPARDASPDEPSPPPEEERPPDEPPAPVELLALPARGEACAPTCPRPDDDWTELAPGVAYATFCHHLNCVATGVIVDCCAPIDPADAHAVTTALGWDRADATGRAQIAQAYVVVMTSGHALSGADVIEGHVVSAPEVTSKDGGVTIALWERVFHSLSRHSLVHTRWTFSSNGNATSETLASFALKELDPQLAREQALKAAREAGILRDAAPAP